MPRKTKQTATKEVIVTETPVVFSLKITENAAIETTIIPAGETTSYSDILSSVEISKVSNTFNTDLLKSILDKVVAD